MRRVIRAVALMVLGILTCSVVFYYQHIQYVWQEMQKNYVIILNQSRIQEELLKIDTQDENLQRLREKVVLVHYENMGEVKNEEFARTATPYILEMNGTTSVAFPDTFLLTPEDTNACLIDNKTAIALFGSTNVIGKAITYQGHSYDIYGLIDSRLPVFAYIDETDKQEEKKEQPYYQIALLRAASKEDMEETAKQLKLYFGIDGKTYPLWKFEFFSRFFI